MLESQERDDDGRSAPKSVQSLLKIRRAGQDRFAVNLIKEVDQRFGDLADRQAVILALANLVRSLPDQTLSKGFKT